MTTTLTRTFTRLAMAAPIVAALFALTSGWDTAEAKPGPNIDDTITNHPIVDPPKPPIKKFPIVDISDVDTVDPGDAPEPPADPADPADTDTDDTDHDVHSDHDDDDTDKGSHGGKSTGGSSTGSVRPALGKPAPVVEETDTVFQASDARNAAQEVAPSLTNGGGAPVPAGVVFGVGAALMAVIGWAAFRHHRLTV